jgi:hypothetical protein
MREQRSHEHGGGSLLRMPNSQAADTYTSNASHHAHRVHI